MSVRAKFLVKTISESKHWDASKPNIKSIELVPVTSGSEENKAFYAATPSGNINLFTINYDAASQFVIGAEYYLDFTPA